MAWEVGWGVILESVFSKYENRKWPRTKPWYYGRNGANLHSLNYPLHPWAIKKQLQGATICCQNAPVAILHKDIINYRNSYICCELSFGSYFTCFHNKYFKENQSLCVFTRYILVTLTCIMKIASGSFGIVPGSSQISVKQAQFWNANCPWFPPSNISRLGNTWESTLCICSLSSYCFHLFDLKFYCWSLLFRSWSIHFYSSWMPSDKITLHSTSHKMPKHV